MKIRNSVLLLLGTMLLLPVCVQARGGHDRIVWTSTPNSQTGLYTTRNYFVTNGVSINLSTFYYFGDVDNEGVAFHGGFNTKNLSLGGGFFFGYNMPIGNHCNLRFSFLTGTLHGDNTLKFNSLPTPRDDYRKFKSILLQPAVGVQYYPFNRAGFYLYGGLALSASIITKYEFWYYKKVGYNRERTLVEGSTVGILPMLQLGLGYSWKLNESWTLGVEVMIQEGLIDTPYMNLDAWPLDPTQNSDGVKLGKSFGKWTDRFGKEHIHWNDGWFQAGITITYQWRNCEHCRILNNYTGIRPNRR